MIANKEREWSIQLDEVYLFENSTAVELWRSGVTLFFFFSSLSKGLYIQSNSTVQDRHWGLEGALFKNAFYIYYGRKGMTQLKVAFII